MFSLFINDQEAVISHNTSFKLTRENPMFSSSGDYTLDVTLPLEGCVENLRIFGAIHRREIPLRDALKTKYQFSLQADTISLVGVALIKSITEAEAKVQLVAGNRLFSALAYDEEGAEKYIDELPLGQAYDTLFRQIYPVEAAEQTLERTIELFYRSEALSKFMHSGFPIGVHNDGFGRFGGAECVCYPIYSTTDGDYSNNIYLNLFAKNEVSTSGGRIIGAGEIYEFPLTLTSNSESGKHWQTEVPKTIPRTIAFAPQPYLCVVLERILAIAFNLTLDVQDNALRWDEKLSSLFIANSRITMEYAKTLPHWTVSQFIREIQNFCGVEIQVIGDRVRVVSRSKAYSDESQIIELNDVLAEHTAELDAEEGSADTSTANIGYAWPSIERSLNLPNDIWNRAPIRHISTPDDMLNTIGYTEVDWNAIYITADGRNYAYTDRDRGYFTEINQGGPLIRRTDTRELDIELKIVPCLMDRLPLRYARYQHIAGNIYRFISEGDDRYTRPVLITADTRTANSGASFSLWDAVEEKEQTRNDRDILEVATSNSFTVIDFTAVDGTRLGRSVFSPLGFNYAADPQNKTMLVAGPDASQFNLHADLKHTVGARVPDDFVIDTRVQYAFTFISNQHLDPTAVYHIGTRRFLCVKLEFTITPEGVLPLKTGYFYELA